MNFLPVSGIKTALNNTPEKHQRIKEVSGEERRIIFFRILASHPVKTRASIRKKIDIQKFLSLQAAAEGVMSTRLPAVISNIPAIPVIEGSSPSSTKALTSPTIDLYEFNGPKIDNSPSFRAFIRQIVPSEQKSPARRT